MLDVFERYQTEVIPTKAQATQESDEKALQSLRTVFAHLAPDTITPTMIVAFVDRRSATAPIRANREAALLSAIFTKCLHWGIVQSNPVLHLRYKNPETPRIRYVTDWELWRAMRLAPTLIRYMMWLCNLTGLRRADILGIRWDDFNDEGLQVTVRKSKRRGAVAKKLLFLWSQSLEKLYARIREWNPKMAGVVFPVKLSTLERTWTQFQNRVVESGIERFQMKDLRAKYGTDLAERGGDATRNLAHSSATTTRRHYSRRPVKIKGK